MILEAVRIVDAALKDATIGVAAQLATVPKESGDSVPTTPTYYNETQHGEAARESIPDGVGPFVLVSSGQTSDTNPGIRPITDASVEVLIRYATRDADTEVAMRAASYTMRAIRRTLGLITTTAAGEALRIRNNVHLVSVDSVRWMMIAAPVGDTALTWGLSITCRCRDLWATA